MRTGESTKDRILAAAIDVIEQHGEAAVRVVEVAHAAGVTQGMVNYHFRTRTKLVIEAQRQRFLASFADDVDSALAAVATVDSRDDVVRIAAGLTRAILDPTRYAARRSRLNALGYAAGSSQLWSTLSADHTEYVDGFTAVFADIQQRGFLRADLDPRAIATMVVAYSFGLVLVPLDQRPPTPTALAAVIDRFIASVLSD